MHFRAAFFLVPAMLLSLGACFSDPADEVQPSQTSAAPPAEVCSQFRTGLEAMRDKGAIDYEDDGSAVVEETTWMALKAEGREQVGKMLAFHASCIAGEGSAVQQIMIRNEHGAVVSRRTIDTRINTMSMIAD